MSDTDQQLPAPPDDEQLLLPSEQLNLAVTLDGVAGTFRFEWSRAGAEPVACGVLSAAEQTIFLHRSLNWVVEQDGELSRDGCNGWPASTRALLNRIRKRFPVSNEAIRIGLLTIADLGTAQAGRWLPMSPPRGTDPWKWIGNQVQQFARMVESDAFREAGAPGRTEHARLRADQLARHEIRVHPHIDAVLLVAERAWRGDLAVQHTHCYENMSAVFVPRARRWQLPRTA